MVAMVDGGTPKNQTHYLLWLENGIIVKLVIYYILHGIFIIYGVWRRLILPVQYQVDAQYNQKAHQKIGMTRD